MAREFTQEDDALLTELGVEVKTRNAVGRTPREERIIAGFEEIQRFTEEHGRAPQHGEERDIFERLYAARFDRICELQEYRALVEPLDHQGLLTGAAQALPDETEKLDDDALLRGYSYGASSPSYSAAATLAGIEVAHMIRKEQFQTHHISPLKQFASLKL